MNYLLFNLDEFDFIKSSSDVKIFKLTRKITNLIGVPSIIALNSFDHKEVADKKEYISKLCRGKKGLKVKIRSHVKIETVYNKKIITLAVFLSNYDNIITSILSDRFYPSGGYPLEYMLNILSNDKCLIFITDIHKIKFDNKKSNAIVDFIEEILENNDSIDGVEIKNDYPNELKRLLKEYIEFNESTVQACYEVQYIDLFERNKGII